MRQFDDESIHAQKPFERHCILERNQEPSDDVRRRNVGEECVRLDHGNGVHCKQELMLLVGVLDNSHEGVCQDCDEDRDDQEVTNEEEQSK